MQKAILGPCTLLGKQALSPAVALGGNPLFVEVDKGPCAATPVETLFVDIGKGARAATTVKTLTVEVEKGARAASTVKTSAAGIPGLHVMHQLIIAGVGDRGPAAAERL